jgi:beta-1,4-N-acetylglucosaminyltransferase
VIFVTVGSSHIPFQRLVDALDALPGDELVVQHGPAAPPAAAARAVPFMSFAEVLEHIEAADHVVSHAGVGSITCALRAGHTPVVVPRLKRHGETVDDHQLELVEALSAEGRILAVLDPAELARAVAAAPARRPAPAVSERPIHAAVRAALYGQAPRKQPAL